MHFSVSCDKLTLITHKKGKWYRMIKKWNITIPELTGKTRRRAYVYIPNEYRRNPDARYPVLYMFDGHNVFFDSHATYGKSWGMKEYMDRTRTPMIIAAVECNHSPDKGRLKEYSPFTFDTPELGHIDGVGRTTMEWLVHTFKPMIDSAFPTIPDREHTYIAGSSMGGLMSLYAVMEYNHVFSRAAALSPSIWFAKRDLDRMLRKAPIGPDTVVYMDYGSREMSFHKSMKGQFQKVTDRLLERGVMLNSRIVPNGDHCEACWEEQIPFFMNTLLYTRGG